MQVTARQAVGGLVLAGVAGAFLVLPALSLIGTLLAPSQPTPSHVHVSQLLGDAIWARSGAGHTSTELAPINPFTVGRMAACHLLAERFDTQLERERQHDECMKLMPGLQGIGYLSTVHMRRAGVWQDPRVPFVQIANMTKISSTWTRADLIGSLAERGEFGALFQGAGAAARGYFGRAPDDVTLPQAAMLAGLLGDRRIDPWCAPERAAALRHRILERMRDDHVIDEPAYQQADVSELGLGAAPPVHPPCPE